MISLRGICVALVVLFSAAGFCYAQGGEQKTQQLTTEADGVTATLQLTDFTLDAEGYIIGRGHGIMFHVFSDDLLPESMDLGIWHSQCSGVKSFATKTVVWVEPTKNPAVLQIIADNEQIPDDSLLKLGITKAQLPELKIFLQFRPISGGRYGVLPVICDGVRIYGATKGPIKLDGSMHSNINGAEIIDAKLVKDPKGK